MTSETYRGKDFFIEPRGDQWLYVNTMWELACEFPDIESALEYHEWVMWRAEQ